MQRPFLTDLLADSVRGNHKYQAPRFVRQALRVVPTHTAAPNALGLPPTHTTVGPSAFAGTALQGRQGRLSSVDECSGLTPCCPYLPGLIEALRQELPPRPVRRAPVDLQVVRRVQVLRHTKLNTREWRQHAVFRRGRYTRTIAGYSPGQFVALLLCWGKGQQSPIHDHTGAHCFVKMLQGKLKEETFDWPADGRAKCEASVRRR